MMSYLLGKALGGLIVPSGGVAGVAIAYVQSYSGSEVLITFAADVGWEDPYAAMETFTINNGGNIRHFLDFAGIGSNNLDVLMDGAVNVDDTWSWITAANNATPPVALPASGTVTDV